jgi:hypothetical protein
MRNPTVYEDALSRFHGEKIMKIRAIINELLNLEEGENEGEKNRNNIIRRIALNLTRETNVQIEYMYEILDLVHHTFENYVHPFHAEGEEFLERYYLVCGEHQLEGRLIDKSGIDCFGHAVYEKTFKTRIAFANHNKFPNNYVDKDDFLEDLKKMSVTEIRELKDFRSFVMNGSKRIMWATWSQNLDGEDPFDFMGTRNLQADPPELGSLYEVGLSLGLCYEILTTDECSNMLLLTYEADGIDAHIPTIADARGNRYFSPCLRGANHGWTDTDHQDLQDYYITRLLSGESEYNDQPRPEAVHKPIQMDCLRNIYELPIPNSP